MYFLGSFSILVTKLSKWLDREVIEDYKNRDLPIAVCLNEKDSYCDKYILIDGYHRFIANKDKRMMIIVVLE